MVNKFNHTLGQIGRLVLKTTLSLSIAIPAFAGSHFDQLSERFDQAKLPTTHEVKGAWAGRCYGTFADPNQPMGSLMYFKETVAEGDHGPGFPSELETHFGLVRHQDPKMFDEMDKSTARDWLKQRGEIFLAQQDEHRHSIRVRYTGIQHQPLVYKIRLGDDGFLYVQGGQDKDPQLYCYFFQSLDNHHGHNGDSDGDFDDGYDDGFEDEDNTIAVPER